MHSAALGAGRGKLALSLSGLLSFHRRVTLLSARHQHSHGGDGRDRTDDLMLAKQPLSQLSYVPERISLLQESQGDGGNP